MGSLNLGSIGQALGSVFGGAQSADPLAALRAGQAQGGNMSAPVMGFPSIDLGNNSPQPQGGPTAGMPDWQPKKPTVLGAIADAYLMSQGMKPSFAEQRDLKNLQGAMGGFTEDPLAAIKRVGSIQGHADDAWKMYDQYQDNVRGSDTNDRQTRALDMRNDDYVFQQTAGMMGAATPDNWTQMRDLAIRRAQSRGTDVSSIIPETYDADSVKFMQYGAVKPKDQMVIKERKDYHDARLGQIDETIDERGRHNQATENQQATNEAGRAGRAEARQNAPRKGAKIPDKIISTKYGAGKVFNNGQNLSVKAGKKPDGSDRYAIYERSPDNKGWHLAGYQ